MWDVTNFVKTQSIPEISFSVRLLVPRTCNRKFLKTAAEAVQPNPASIIAEAGVTVDKTVTVSTSVKPEQGIISDKDEGHGTFSPFGCSNLMSETKGARWQSRFITNRLV